jgi:hypothetical protein
MRRVLALGEEAERLRPTTRSSSQPGAKPTVVQITNGSTKPVKLCWVDFEGREDINRVETVSPGGIFRHQTTTGHAFAGRDEEGQMLLLYVPLQTDGEHKLTITASTPPAVEEEKPAALRSLWFDLAIFVAVIAMLCYFRDKRQR